MASAQTVEAGKEKDFNRDDYRIMFGRFYPNGRVRFIRGIAELAVQSTLLATQAEGIVNAVSEQERLIRLASGLTVAFAFRFYMGLHEVRRI